jgi:hypothetical protein
VIEESWSVVPPPGIKRRRDRRLGAAEFIALGRRLAQYPAASLAGAKITGRSGWGEMITRINVSVPVPELEPLFMPTNVTLLPPLGEEDTAELPDWPLTGPSDG